MKKVSCVEIFSQTINNMVETIVVQIGNYCDKFKKRKILLHICIYILGKFSQPYIIISSLPPSVIFPL